MSKKQKQLYDEDGHWVEERGRIKGAIRRTFRLSPQMKETLELARVELPPDIKKDGTPGKRPRVRYKCAECGELFSQKHVQVDHIDTVVPLWKKESEMTYDEIVRGVFCSKDNLQVLCSISIKDNNGEKSCHLKKTNKEKWLRSRFAKQGQANIQALENRATGSHTVYVSDNPMDFQRSIDECIKMFEQEYAEQLNKNDRKKRKKRKSS